MENVRLYRQMKCVIIKTCKMFQNKNTRMGEKEKQDERKINSKI